VNSLSAVSFSFSYLPFLLPTLKASGVFFFFFFFGSVSLVFKATTYAILAPGGIHKEGSCRHEFAFWEGFSHMMALFVPWWLPRMTGAPDIVIFGRLTGLGRC
jgi:hypothetical protein